MSTVNERLLNSLKQKMDKIIDKEPPKIELDLSDPMAFVEKYVALPEKAPTTQKTWFEKRPWLNKLYHDESKRIIIVKGRQIEISEFAVNMLFYWALKKPGKYAYASSSGDKANIFSRDRFNKQLRRSPSIQALTRESAVKRYVYGGSEIYFMTAFEDTKTLRSIDADAVILDEFQDYRANAIPIAEQGMSHSSVDRIWVIGTPLLTGTNFSKVWDGSTKEEWNKNDSTWTLTNPESDGRWSGYHLGQEISVGVWRTQEELDYKRNHLPRQEYMNEVLGLFYSGLGRPTDYGYMSSLFSPSLTKGEVGKTDLLLAGVDWGVSKSNTVFFMIRPRLVELPDTYSIDVVYVEKIDEPDVIKQIARVASLLKLFNVSLCALDYGSGYVQNQELYKLLGNRVMSVHLGNGKAGKPISLQPTQFGNLAEVNRTWAIDIGMDYVTRPERFRFYHETDEGTKDWIINDFLAEYPELSLGSGQKMWIHNRDTTDDALMAYVNCIVAFQLQKGTVMSDNLTDMIGFV
jgi:hypothetical protein